MFCIPALLLTQTPPAAKKKLLLSDAPTHTLTNITQAALPAVWAETLEGVDPIDAGASVLTRGGCTVIDVCRQGERKYLQMLSYSFYLLFFSQFTIFKRQKTQRITRQVFVIPGFCFYFLFSMHVLLCCYIFLTNLTLSLLICCRSISFVAQMSNDQLHIHLYQPLRIRETKCVCLSWRARIWKTSSENTKPTPPPSNGM